MMHTGRAIAASLALLLGLALAVPARAIEVLSGTATELSLEVGQGRLIRLDRPAATVLLADEEVANVRFDEVSSSLRLVWVYARAPGVTNLLAVDGNDALVANIRVTVRQAVGELNQGLAQVSPRGNLTARAVQNNVLITGRADSPIEAANVERMARSFVPADNIINQTRIDGPTQINLRVRVAEVSRSASRSLGINWSASVQSGDFAFSFLTALPVDGTISALAAAFSGGNYDITAFIDALQTEGFATVLAEPNLTTVAGQTASFFAGRQIPVITDIDREDGANTISYTLQNVGVDLAFTPTLLNDGRISMRVHPRVRSIAGERDIGAGFSVPEFATREVETTVELGSGQSFAIAGLFRSDVGTRNSRVPLLGDVPVVGNLFRSNSIDRDETELVIVVTPYLVQPVSESASILAPSDPLSAPNDRTVEDFVLDRSAPTTVLDSPDAAPVMASGQRPVASGFILN